MNEMTTGALNPRHPKVRDLLARTRYEGAGLYEVMGELRASLVSSHAAAMTRLFLGWTE